MSSELLAIEESRLYTATPQAGSVGIPAPVSGFTITETPCARLKASGKKVIGGNVNFVPIGCTAGGGYVLASGVGFISPSATKAKSDGLVPLREGDEGTCTGTQTGPAGSIVCNCKMRIEFSGQLKAKCV